MIRLEQIRLLEKKTNEAVEKIKLLKKENQTLKTALDSSQKRMNELEKMVEEFKSDQGEIEQCLLRALKNLDFLEDEVSGEIKTGKKEAIKPTRDLLNTDTAESNKIKNDISGINSDENLKTQKKENETESRKGNLPFKTVEEGETKKELDIF